jgi:hypothetical protein
MRTKMIRGKSVELKQVAQSGHERGFVGSFGDCKEFKNNRLTSASERCFIAPQQFKL